MLAATHFLFAFAGERDLSGYSFTSFENEWSKTYANEKERAERAAIFTSNLAKVLAHNANPSKSWFATINEFSDLTPDEFKTKKTGKVRMPSTLSTIKPPPSRPVKTLPASVDWRSKGVVTEVKNQAACGSCWAFSATEAMESALAIATSEPPPVLSPQQIVSCSPNPQHCGGSGGCDGSTQELAFNYTMAAGQTLERDYPYAGVTGTCQQQKIKPVAINKGYVKLPENNYTDLMNAVANVGPIAISVAASGFAFQFYGGGIVDGSCGWIEDHAVGLVGYGSENGKMYWIVRNSWGTRWGEDGYIRLGRYGEGKEPCGVDKHPLDGSACEGDTDPITICGMCGVLSDSSYPTGVSKVTEVVEA